MRTFDSHLHLFSRGVFRSYAVQVPDLASAPDPALAAIERLKIEAPPPEPEALAARWASELDRNGVARSVLFGSAPGEQETVARAVRAFPDRFVGLQMLNPRAADSLRDSVACGLRGVLLFPAMHGFFPDDAVCRPVYEAARKHRLIVFVHLGHLRIAIREKLGVAGAFDERFGDPTRLAGVLREFSDVTFIVPHFGCGVLTPLLGATKGMRNLYLDSSSSNEWIGRTPEFADLRSVFRAVLDAPTFGPDRILFGTDSTVFPRGWRRDIYEAQREALDAIHAIPDEQAAIFGGNAERLFRAT